MGRLPLYDNVAAGVSSSPIAREKSFTCPEPPCRDRRDRFSRTSEKRLALGQTSCKKVEIGRDKQGLLGGTGVGGACKDGFGKALRGGETCKMCEMCKTTVPLPR